MCEDGTKIFCFRHALVEKKGTHREGTAIRGGISHFTKASVLSAMEAGGH